MTTQLTIPKIKMFSDRLCRPSALAISALAQMGINPAIRKIAKIDKTKSLIHRTITSPFPSDYLERHRPCPLAALTSDPRARLVVLEGAMMSAHAAARSSLSAPRMTILSTSSGNGRCSALASSQDHRHCLGMDRLNKPAADPAFGFHRLRP